MGQLQRRPPSARGEVRRRIPYWEGDKEAAPLPVSYHVFAHDESSTELRRYDFGELLLEEIARSKPTKTNKTRAKILATRLSDLEAKLESELGEDV